MQLSRLAKIALFFIGLGGAGVVYVVATADGMSDFNTKDYEAVLDDATGLTTRSKIYLAGVVVGRVKEIKLVEDGALIKVAFVKNVRLHEDSMLARRSSSILGTSMLVLEPGSDSSPVIKPGGRLGASKDGGDMAAVLGSVGELGSQLSGLITSLQENQLALLSISLETINAFAGKVNEQSDAELERISRILESVALITERMERILADGDRDHQNARPVADVYTALENIRVISDEIAARRGNLGKTVFEDDLYDSIAANLRSLESITGQLNETMVKVNNTASGVESIVGMVNSGLEGSGGTIIQLDTSGNYLFSASHGTANASLRLVPSLDRWYRVGVSSVPVTSRVVVTSPGSSTVDTSETRYSFAVDAEIARTFGMFTVRGGILENTVGLGVDFQPIRWVSASAEIFNFLSGDTPNLRGTITVYPFFDPLSKKPWNWLYIKGGIDDSLKDTRDIFVGGGVRFTAN